MLCTCAVHVYIIRLSSFPVWPVSGPLIANKVDSGVRAIHVDTEIYVISPVSPVHPARPSSLPLLAWHVESALFYFN